MLLNCTLEILKNKFYAMYIVSQEKCENRERKLNGTKTKLL